MNVWAAFFRIAVILSHLGNADFLVGRAGDHQLIMSAIADLTAIFQHKDMISMTDGAGPLSHDNSCGFTEIFSQSLAQPCVCLVIQGAGGIV